MGEKQAARSALTRLNRRKVPWVIVTSKTRAEVEVLQKRLGNEHPFFVENGGAAFVL
jgi:mannosyl-3-phosphoglycerate phosphatase